MNSMIYHGGASNKIPFPGAGGGVIQKQQMTICYNNSDFPEIEIPPISFLGRFIFPDYMYNVPDTGYHGHGYIVPACKVKMLSVLINEFYNDTGNNQEITFSVYRYPANGTVLNPTDPPNNPYAIFVCDISVNIPVTNQAQAWYSGNAVSLDITIPACMLVIVGTAETFTPSIDLFLRRITAFIVLEIL